MNSIIYRITGLVFLCIAATVVILVLLADYQMMAHFQAYLSQQGGVGGSREEAYVRGLHDSLFWVGAGMVLGGLGVSYLLARSIVEPLRQLGRAAEAIASGRYGETVALARRDEVGQLAASFNRMSRSLAEAVRLRQRFLADAAHELRTPLAVIQGNLEGMLDGVVPADEAHLASLRDEALQLNRLIRELRDLSLAEAGQLPLERQPLELGALALRAVNMLQPVAEERQLALTARVRPLAPLSLDGGRLNQVLYNLLTNALRHTSRGGWVRVEVYPEGGEAVLAVEDNGEGIAPEHLPHIFDHFYRADASRDRRSGGSGIGLAIVQRLVALHGGTVSVASRPGGGSRFEVRLPRR